MQCPSSSPEKAELLLAYVAGRLDAGAAALLERHLKECAECRERAGAQQAIWRMLGQWKPEPVPADFDTRLYARIAADRRPSWWRQLFQPVLPFSLRPVMPLAAAFLVLVAALLVREPADFSVEEAVAVEPVDIEQVERVLEDMEMLYFLHVELHAEDEGTRTL